jgi:LysR family glycine cleavage system transcriptional activator
MPEQRRNLPSLDLLRGFEAAARNLSFTKAAGELFVTQSAVSRQVKTI